MEQELTTLTDAALLAQCQSSDAALEALIRRHFRLVTACARSFFLAGAEESDLVQEGLIGLLGAIRSYNPARETDFPAYASVCIRRRMISAVRAANAEKNSPLNDSVPLDTQDSAPSTEEPEAAYLGKEGREDLLSRLRSQLSPFERQVLPLYLEGYSGREIARLLERPAKSADNAIQRIRAKAAKTFPGR